MEWVQFVIFFIGVFGLFIWVRTESRNDARHMDNKISANRELIRTGTEANRELIREIIGAIHLEMKDFHGRLCQIEERNKK